MLVVAGTISIDPANQDAAIAAAREVAEETHKESGNISYAFSSDLSEAGVFHVFEEWESQEALDAHFQSPHMAKFQGALGGLGVKGLNVQRYQVSSVGPLR